MDIGQLKSEVDKGIKVFRVFESIGEFLNEAESLKQLASDQKRTQRKISKENDVLSESIQTLNNEMVILEKQAGVIISEAKAEAKKLRDDARERSRQSTIKANKRQEDLMRQIKDKEDFLKVLTQDTNEKHDDLMTIKTELDKAKERLRGLLS